MSDRPCELHPPPSTLASVYCRKCGAWRTDVSAPVEYVERDRKPYVAPALIPLEVVYGDVHRGRILVCPAVQVIEVDVHWDHYPDVTIKATRLDP